MGISGASAGARHLLQGRVETRSEPGLRKSVIHEAGDFIFIPADVPHRHVNLSAAEPTHALAAWNDSNEQESVVAYDPAADSSFRSSVLFNVCCLGRR